MHDSISHRLTQCHANGSVHVTQSRNVACSAKNSRRVTKETYLRAKHAGGWRRNIEISFSITEWSYSRKSRNLMYRPVIFAVQAEV